MVMVMTGFAMTALIVVGAMAGGDDYDNACPTKSSSMMQTKYPLKRSRSLSASETSETVTALVRYKNSNGKAAADGVDSRGHGVDMPHLRTETIVASKSALEELMKNPDIESVEEDLATYEATIFHRGEAFAGLGTEEEPYGLEMVNADEVPQGSTKIKVCVVDTGYGLGHPDLPTDATGTSVGGNGDWDLDGNSHGTHCAGTIGAIGGNDIGVNSVNPDPDKFSFHIGKGLSDSGSGSNAGVLLAVEGCLAANASIISMSLGGGSQSNIFAEDMREAYEDFGVLIVAAAGNGGNGAHSYPASYPHVMSVAAVGSDGTRASFSQFTDQVEIAAPGVGVKSTVTTNSGQQFGYASYSGTSMATPHVAGVAALVWSHFPNCTNEQIRNVLLRTAQRGDADCNPEYGWGIVDAKAAYDYLVDRGCAGGDISKNGASGGCEQIITAPTPAPPPTPPPPPCDTCERRTFEVILTTDNYPGETSWRLEDVGGNEISSGSNYQAAGTEYTESVCVGHEDYTFTITDAYGDGMCCSYGSGSYILKMNGEVIKEGGEFAASEVVHIDGCDLVPTPAPPTPAPPTPAPTPAPTPEPTPAPTPPSMHHLLRACSTWSKPVVDAYGAARLELDTESTGEAICCDSEGTAFRKVDGECTGKGKGNDMKTYDEALAICQGAGMGLCSSQEQLDTTCGGGCLMNRALVWTSLTLDYDALA